MNNLVQQYVDEGLHIFPCNLDKTPMTQRGFQDATCDENTVKRFWKEDLYIGLPTGKVNGIVVVDIDVFKKIYQSDDIDQRSVEDIKEEVEQSYGKLPNTFEVETKSGGRHLYYRYPENIERIPPRARFLDKTLPVDIRGDDSYVITVDNKDYTIYDDFEEKGISGLLSRCAVLPEWIVSYAKETQSQTTQQEIEGVLPESEIREIRSALSYLSSENRDDWIKTGIALKSTGSPSAFGLWQEWSKTSDKYNPDDMEKRWRGLKPKGDLTIASIFHEAKKFGWVTTYEKQNTIPQNLHIAQTCVEITEIEKDHIEKRKKELQKNPFPEDLLVPDGLVGEIAQYITSRAILPQPVFSLSAALCAVGTLAGRKIRSETDIRPNLYCLNVGGSGSGKDVPRKIIKKLFEDSGCSELAQVDTLASDSAIETELQRQKSQIFLLDEIGRFLQTTSKGSSYLYNVVSVLLRLYSSADETYYCKSYADKERKQSIDQPSLSLLGSTVPDNLYQGLSYESATDGFLSRMLIFETDNDLPRKKKRKDIIFEPPKSLIDKIIKLHEKKTNVNPSGNIDNVQRARPQTVPMSENAYDILDDFDDYIYNLRKDLKNENKIDAMYNRVSELSVKIAMIVAVGIDADNPIMTENEIMYGISVAKHLTDHLRHVVENYMAKNDYEHETKNIFNIISRTGSASLTQIALNTQHLPTYQRDNIIQSLIESDQIQERVTIMPDKSQRRIFCLR